MNDDPQEKTEKIEVPRHVHRDIQDSAKDSATEATWTPPPLPRWPDQRKRYSLHAKIEQARRKAVDMDVVYLLDELTKLLQCVSMASRGVIEQASDVDRDDKSVTENPGNDVTKNQDAGGVTKKGEGGKRGRPVTGKATTSAERMRDLRRRKAEKIIKR